jgi:choline/ethanolamine kinase
LDPRKYPTLQQQRAFLSTYLLERRRNLKQREAEGDPTVNDVKNPGDDLPFEEDLDKLILEVNQFAMASHFLWSCWAIIQASTSDIQFGYLEFATSRMEDYFRRKNDFFYAKKFDSVVEDPSTYVISMRFSRSCIVFDC